MSRVELAVYGIGASNVDAARAMVARAERRQVSCVVAVRSHEVPGIDAVAARWLCEAESRGHRIEVDARMQRQHHRRVARSAADANAQATSLFEELSITRLGLRDIGAHATGIVTAQHQHTPAFAHAVGRAGYEYWVSHAGVHHTAEGRTDAVEWLPVQRRWNDKTAERSMRSAIGHLVRHRTGRLVLEAATYDARMAHVVDNLVDVVHYYTSDIGATAHVAHPTPV